MRRFARGRALIAAAVLSFSNAEQARAGMEIDLELVLAIDVSSSVSAEEFDLQLRGLAEAFQHPDVITAIEVSAPRGVAVTVVHWAGRDQQDLAVGWTLVRDRASALGLSRKIRRAGRRIDGQTGVDNALGYALSQIAGNGYDGWRKVIDISGDGQSNDGALFLKSRVRAQNLGITINGLAILNEEPFVDAYFREHVIAGPGAFVMIAEDYDDFAAAIARKLAREIGAPLARGGTSPMPEIR